MRSPIAALFILAALLLQSGCAADSTPEAETHRVERLDDLAALWSFYKFHYIDDGRVVSLDEDRITTSEGQGYAMLRAVWSEDRDTFERVWQWTKQHLQVRDDRLFAWKWKGRVLDVHSATDADTDIALALLLASRAFDEETYAAEARGIIDDIWDREILRVGDAYFPTAGDWAHGEPVPTIHVAYLAPYAYAEFAKVDPVHPWKQVIDTSYDVLHWIYFDRDLALPPEIIYVDRETGGLQLASPRGGKISDFGYDAFPIFWRLALDEHWHARWQSPLRKRMLEPLRRAYQETGRLVDRYDLTGRPLSNLEALPLYATAHSLAVVEDEAFAAKLQAEKLDGLWVAALAGRDSPYYLHNWLWFDRAFELELSRRYDELLGFLYPFDSRAFRAAFPWIPFFGSLLLFPFARFARGPVWRPIAVTAFLLPAFAVCIQYLAWRGMHTLNFIEPLGPTISISLWVAELYCFFSVVLLVAQVGVGARRPRARPDGTGYRPRVDVLIPIFREPIGILERTLLAARAIHYAPLEVWVLDDGRREEVRALAEEMGARYLPGPQKHAKAGNLNHAVPRCEGELIVVLDTDHVPVASFLEEIVPWFQDPDVGFVQTPHHFSNPDIFQRAFRVSGRIPNEQDMFNHAIQARRDDWGGAFFVGSGAVFRREAIEGIAGFKLMSITEDIHTSQHLHAAGWRSVFVDRDLAVGLAAENLASYVVQRRRWMLGCLQIFFRDNPLLLRGLSWRQRIGYFASLYYFFFPLARVVFWMAPLAYLLFHLHPLFSQVSVLTALLIPYLVVLPMISTVLVPGWPRPLWGPFYESAVSATLARSMLDLLLPKSLGFAVTPKGLTTEKSRFDWRSTKWTLLLAAVMAFGIAKGLLEFELFGIEKDAYFFNLTWAGFNLFFLAAAIMVAWERPQRRTEVRVPCPLPTTIRLEDDVVGAEVRDLSATGCALEPERAVRLPPEFTIELGAGDDALVLRGRLVYHERIHRRDRVGVEFVSMSRALRRELVLRVMAAPETWARAHEGETRGYLAAAALFVAAVVRFPRAHRKSRRRHPRRMQIKRLRLVGAEGEDAVLLRSVSPLGLGVVRAGVPPAIGSSWRISCLPGAARVGRVVHVRRRLLFFHEIGIAFVAAPQDPPGIEVELAA